MRILPQMKLIGLASILLAVTGCNDVAFKGKQETQPITAYEKWPFRPSSIRIHPFTTFEINEMGQYQLQVHLELLDQQDDAVKGLGHVRLALYALQKNQPDPVFDKQLAEQSVSIDDISKSHRHYDRITRTYVIFMPVEADMMPSQRVRLEVHFTDIYDKHINTDSILTVPEKTQE